MVLNKGCAVVPERPLLL